MGRWMVRLTVLLLLAVGIWTGVGIVPSRAAILQQQERPGQMLYQSRQTLRDPEGNTWQAIVFKRIKPDGEVNLALRLVGFPGAVSLKHPHPLQIVTSLGQEFTVDDISDQISTTDSLTNVGQYQLQPVISNLRPEIPIKLSLATQDNATLNLFVPSPVIQEWVTLAEQPKS